MLEATGIYHEELAYALYEADAWVSAVNPAQLCDYAKSLGTRTKTDKKDALVFACVFWCNPAATAVATGTGRGEAIIGLDSESRDRKTRYSTLTE